MSSLHVPMYDPTLVQPMREELTRLGFRELSTPDADNFQATIPISK